MRSVKLFNPFQNGERYLSHSEIENRLASANVQLAGKEDYERLMLARKIPKEFREVVGRNLIFWGAIEAWNISPLSGLITGTLLPEPLVPRFTVEEVEKAKYKKKMIPVLNVDERNWPYIGDFIWTPYGGSNLDFDSYDRIACLE